MRQAGIIKNDVAAGKGVCVTFFTQGCEQHCPGCHNPETWDFEAGKEFTPQTLNDILESLSANGIQRNLSIMGGEPLAPENVFLTALLINTVKEKYPDIKIYLWTGYLYEDLITERRAEHRLQWILQQINYLIDGPFMLNEKDITLAMRGSRNQRIINMEDKKDDFIHEE